MYMYMYVCKYKDICVYSMYICIKICTCTCMYIVCMYVQCTCMYVLYTLHVHNYIAHLHDVYVKITLIHTCM